MKYHRGINQCHIASDKIIEVRSNGRKVRSSGMKVRSNGMEVRSNGRKVRSNGTRIRSNGMQVAIRLHFCPECPSIELHAILPKNNRNKRNKNLKFYKFLSTWQNIKESLKRICFVCYNHSEHMILLSAC